MKKKTKANKEKQKIFINISYSLGVKKRTNKQIKIYLKNKYIRKKPKEICIN